MKPKPYKRSAHQTKIIEAMKLVYPKLIEEKLKNNGELVVIRDGKIVHLKAEEALRGL